MVNRFTVRPLAITAMRLPGGMVYEGTEAAARKVRTRARVNVMKAGRVDTGALVDSIKLRNPRVLGGRVTISVGSDLHYAGYQEKGIGPYQSPPGKVMRFKPKGSSGYVFATKRRGFDGIHFMAKAIGSLSPSDFKV